MSFSLFIPGVPGAKARPRMTRSGHVFTPPKTASYETYLKNAMAAEIESPMEGPVSMALEFGMPEPKSMAKKHRGKFLPHIKRPDLDNLVKAVTDAGNAVLYLDDNQIATLTARKFYSGTPGVRVIVSPL